MQKIHAGKLLLLFWMVITLAIITTSCASPDANAPFSTGSNQPVKGATLLMQH